MEKEKGLNSDIPVFTPPTPTFKPPKDGAQHNGQSCHYHSNEQATTKCAICGVPICKDCFENYQVISGEYKGKALCYDCCRRIVADNVEQLKANKAKIKLQFILSLIGIVLGFIIGFVGGINEGFGSALLSGLVIGCVGGVFLSVIKEYFRMAIDMIKTVFEAIDGNILGAVFGFFSVCIQSIILTIKCIFMTISNTFYYISYLKRTSGFIESDSSALERMKDYMQYTLIRNQNRGIDINTLLNQKSELANNSYARMVQEKGEEAAEANLRGCVATINENGEIIRSFNNRQAA